MKPMNLSAACTLLPIMPLEISWIARIGHDFVQPRFAFRRIRQHRHHRGDFMSGLYLFDALLSLNLILLIYNHREDHHTPVSGRIDPKPPRSEVSDGPLFQSKRSRELSHGHEWPFADLDTVQLVLPGRER